MIKRLNNDEGVSEVFGYVLILGIVLTGLAVTILIIMPSVQNSKDNSQVKELQQGFTVIDSRLSKARFSTSIFQEAPFSLDNGVVSVDDGTGPSSSSIKVDELWESVPESGNYDKKLNLYTGNLGTIKCVTDKGEVGYQDGGVFALYNKGLPSEACELISPPGFDYNHVTLTLPIMQIKYSPGSTQGTNAASGDFSTMLIESQSTGSTSLLYPTETNKNPLEKGKIVRITIISDYYAGWYSYFKELGLDPDTPDKATRSFSVDLHTGVGFQECAINNNFNTKYMLRSDKKNNYPIEVFDFTLTPTKYDQTTQGANYGAFYQTDPSVYPNLLISIDADGSASNQKYARVIFTYSYSSSKKEQFEGLVPFDRKNPKTFVVNLLYENPTNELIHDDDYNVDYGLMEYTSKDDSITWNSVVDQLYTGDEMTQGDYKSFYDVTQHYMWLMANTDPYKNPASGPTYIYQTHSGGLDTGLSNFNLQFKCDEQVKYLYITEGKLNTGISSRGA